jgi:hypothetical protein
MHLIAEIHQPYLKKGLSSQALVSIHARGGM